MLRGVWLWIFGAIAGAALIALAGCGHNFYSGEREAWRGKAEVACLNSGAIKESPARARISAITGPGICGADYPIRISALGETGPLGYSDEPVRPPAALSSGSAPQHWPVVQSSTAGIRAAADRRSAGARIAGRSGSVRPHAIRHPGGSGAADVALCAGRAGST